MKNIFADNAEVTTLLADIRADAVSQRTSVASNPDHVAYWTLGALKAELHMLAQKFPEVEAHLAARNAHAKERSV